MSDFFKRPPGGAAYEMGMHAERLLLLDRPAPAVAAAFARTLAPPVRFARASAPFAAVVVPVALELAKLVESVCVLEGRAEDAARPPSLDVIPGTSATLCVAYGPRVEHAGGAAPSTLSGLFSSTRSYVPSPAIGVVMVRFKPGALRRFVPAPADALAETNVAAADVWGRALASLEDEVACAPGARERGALVQRFLVERLVPAGWDPLAARVADAIVASNGDVSVRALADGAGLSERQLERRFSAAVGVRPKKFARLARFAHALSLARAGLPWAEVAFASGYADQSHLTREFVALAGASPETLARVARVPTTTDGARPTPAHAASVSSNRER